MASVSGRAQPRRARSATASSTGPAAATRRVASLARSGRVGWRGYEPPRSSTNSPRCESPSCIPGRSPPRSHRRSRKRPNGGWHRGSTSPTAPERSGARRSAAPAGCSASGGRQDAREVAARRAARGGAADRRTRPRRALAAAAPLPAAAPGARRDWNETRDLNLGACFATVVSRYYSRLLAGHRGS